MKRLIVSVVAVVFLLSFGAAEVKAASKSQENTGCGLGAMLITEQDSLIAQLAMTLLNGTLGNQTFGITSGTSNCKQATKVVSNELLNFVASNMDSIAKDIARGEGEAVQTLAELMNVDAGKRGEFYSLLQANFSTIFTSADIEAAAVIDNIVTAVKG